MRHGPADERPDAEAEHQEAGPGADRLGAPLVRCGFGHGRKRAGHRKRGSQPLQRPRADHHEADRRQRDEQRRKCEHGDAGNRGPSRAELIRRAAAHNDEDGGGQEIGIDHPFELRRTKLQAALHVRKRRHDRRAVVAHRQHGKAAGHQHRSEVALGVGGCRHHQCPFRLFQANSMPARRL